MSLIQVRDLSFTYEGSFEPVFEHTSFQIDTDWRLGFTGRNGRGKTTFLKLLMGQYPYRGSISASVGFDYFPFEVPDKSLPVGELTERLCPELPRWRLLKELPALGLEEELLRRPFDTLSNGEQTKLLLALLFCRENRFLLIDEPTNHLDLPGREQVSRYLRGKKGFILVSHDRAFLDGCVDHILSINRASIEVQRGNFSSWWENRQRQDSFELAENEKLKKEIRRLQDAARERASWSDTAERRKTGISRTEVDNVKGWRPLQGAKSKKQMARAKAIETRQAAAIEEKSRLLKDLEEAEALKLTQLRYHSRRLILARELSLDYGSGPVFAPLSFELEQGDRLALQGANGSGKTSLLRMILGELAPGGGTLEVGRGLVISYVPQDSSFLRGSVRDYARQRGLDESLLRAILDKLDLGARELERDLSSLSAGQRKKVLIAGSLCQRAHLHVWDEPMNYIDLISRMQLEELLLRVKPTLLFVEHDRAFCEKVATKVVTL